MGKQTPVFGVEMTGFGGALPQRSFTNEELIKEFSIKTDADIRKLTGIEKRYICYGSENVVTLGVEAGQKALESAGIRPPSEIDYIFVASSTADTYRPISGAHPSIQRELWDQGFHGIASDDRNLACTGFISALVAGYHKFNTDGIDTALVIGTDVMSLKTDYYHDFGTGIIFGDGAGAVVLQRTGSESGLHGWWQETDGREEDLIYADYGEPMHMEGPKVLRHAREAMVKIGQIALEKAEENTGITSDEIDWVVPHQANIRIIDYANDKLGFRKDQLIVDLDEHGNTSTASIPLALLKAVKDERIKRGSKLLVVGFGGGMTAMAGVIEV